MIAPYPQCREKRRERGAVVWEARERAVSYTHLDVYKRQVYKQTKGTKVCVNFIVIHSKKMTLVGHTTRSQCEINVPKIRKLH